MLVFHNATAPSRKRARPSDGVHYRSDAKRPKLHSKLHSAAFYDSLSKIYLTRRALKEHNKRESQRIKLQRPARPSRQLYRAIDAKDIKRFARRGGPDLRDLRGCQASQNLTVTDMSVNYSSRSGRKKSTKSINCPSIATSSKKSSAYDNNFELHLNDNHIYQDGYLYPDGRETPEPVALDELHHCLAQPRPSLSPSRLPDSAFKTFRQKNSRVVDEGEVMRDVLPIICGDSRIPSKQNLLFTKLESIANDTVVDAKPDLYDGAFLNDIDRQVRDDLDAFIIPTAHATAPVAPNFFLEAKAPDGGAGVAKRQACYDGALGARAMHKLQTYGQDVVYDGRAYSIASTYHDGTLKIYTTHPTEGLGGSTEYHMTQVDSWGLTGNSASFRKGAAALRNARDWAHTQRSTLISAANERANSMHKVQPSLYKRTDQQSNDLASTAFILTGSSNLPNGQQQQQHTVSKQAGTQIEEGQAEEENRTQPSQAEPSTTSSSKKTLNSEITLTNSSAEAQVSIEEPAPEITSRLRATNKRLTKTHDNHTAVTKIRRRRKVPGNRQYHPT